MVSSLFATLWYVQGKLTYIHVAVYFLTESLLVQKCTYLQMITVQGFVEVGCEGHTAINPCMAHVVMCLLYRKIPSIHYFHNEAI